MTIGITTEMKMAMEAACGEKFNIEAEAGPIAGLRDVLRIIQRDYVLQPVQKFIEPRRKLNGGPGTNSGHGWIWDRPDGRKARCGGPAICAVCARDAGEWTNAGEWANKGQTYGEVNG